MSDSTLIRLRHHAKDERNTAFARSTMREAEQELAALRNDLADALDCKNGAGPTALSLVIDERDSLRAELAASREREARMRAIAESAIKTRSRDVSDWADDMRRIAALAEGEQG